jgi:hypothetical protein
MRVICALLISLLCVISLNSQAAWGVYKTGISVNSTFYDCQWASVAPDFEGAYLGRYSTGGTLALNFAEVLTWKNGSSNVCQPTMFYRVYRTCDTPPAFTPFGVTFCCNQGGSNCVAAGGGGCGPDVNNAGDQKWFASTLSVNWLSGLTAPGSYVVEVYFEIPGDDSNPTGCGSPSQFSSNGGNNFRAYFEYEINDSFSDSNLLNPTWTGDNGNFTIATKSDAAGLLGSEQNNSYALRLNAPLSNGSEYLSTALTTWNAQQEWYFWHGRRNIAASVADQTIIWLYANESNLESATVDGYRMVIGDDTGNDEIRLQRVDNGTGTDILVTTATIPNGIVDWGATFRVTRSTSGRWVIRTSTLPNISGAGATAFSCPETLSTVLQANSLNGQNYADDNTYIPSGTGYIGVVALHGSSAAAAAGQEFDNFRIRALPPDTELNFALSGATIAENLGGGTHTITVNIISPSPAVATTVQVALISGSATRINNYTTQTLTFPANNGSPQNLTLSVTNNDLCDGTANLVFQLQNPTGGTNAFIGTQSTYSLTITDDNTGYDTPLAGTFEAGNITGWTPVVASGSSGTWSASTSNPITGTYSLRHTFTGTAGSTYVYSGAENAALPGVETIWRFNLRTFLLEPGPANKWQVFLAANESDLYGSSVDGYAVGVDPAGSGDPDVLTLWRVVNGAMSVPVVQADISDVIYDWGFAQDIVGFEIVRSSTGNWTLRVDTNGGFDNLSVIGSGNDVTYTEMNFFGMRFIHTGSNGGKLALDDLAITQSGCRDIYYSRATGNFTDPIWSSQPTGLPNPSTIQPGRWTRLVVQPAHTVTMNTSVVCDDFSILGTVDGSSSAQQVYGDWLNAGTYNGNTATVILKGDESPGQSVGGAATTRFHNLTIQNSFGTVNLNSATEIAGVLLPSLGTLQTNGNLTLISNASLSGSIGVISAGASVAGNVTIQRFIPSATAGWVFLGCPIPGQTINSAWNDDIVTTGFTGSDFPPPGYTFNNVQRYDESQPGNRNVGWVPATNVTNVLSSTFGYNVYMNSSAQNIDVTGTIQSGSVAVAVPFTNNANVADGWNIMTNIYPSEIDWVALEGNSNDFATYYVYDSSLPGYRTYNANSQVGSASRYIPHSQAFFVRSTIAGQTLNFAENQKTSTNAAFERSTEDSRMIAFRLERNGLADEAILNFTEGATDAFEHAYDAEKWESLNTSSPELGLVSSDNMLLTIDARPLITDGTSIPVSLDLPAAGTYTFLVQEVMNLQPGVCMTIQDLVTGETFSASEGSELTVTVDAPFVGQRLMIHFSPAVEVLTTNATCFDADNGAIALAAVAGNWNYTLLNEAGIPVSAGASFAAIENLPAGFYSLELANSDAACGTSSVSLIIEEPAQITTWSGSSKSSCNITADGMLEFGVNGAELYTYSVTRANGNVVASGETADFAMVLENLVGDVYTITVTTTCGTYTMEQNLRDPLALDAAIVASATSVEITEGTSATISFEADATGATAFTWMWADELLSTEAGFSYSFDQAGTYPIVLLASNESCESTAAVNIVVNEVVNVASTDATEAVTLLQANGGVSLTFNGINSRRAEIRLINTLGQVACSERATPADGQRVFIALDALASGAYTVQVIADGKEVFARQIVK